MQLFTVDRFKYNKIPIGVSIHQSITYTRVKVRGGHENVDTILLFLSSYGQFFVSDSKVS